MRVKCYSIKLDSLYQITEKCYKAIAFDGSEALIPVSQYYGIDHDVTKSEAHWVSEWILDKIDIQHSRKKEGHFNSKTGERMPIYNFDKHVPKKIIDVNIDIDNELIKQPNKSNR